VFVQSFDAESLQVLRAQLPVPLVQLVDDDAPHLVTAENLAVIAAYADAVGVHKSLVIPRIADGTLGAPGPLVAGAHATGLTVHAFTFRDENIFLPTDLRHGPGDADRGDGRAECVAFLEAGVDGLFADYPDTAVAARDLVTGGTDRTVQTIRWSS
jgi:glycerophosphoryl diester phosphodiesterase